MRIAWDRYQEESDQFHAQGVKRKGQRTAHKDSSVFCRCHRAPAQALPFGISFACSISFQVWEINASLVGRQVRS